MKRIPHKLLIYSIVVEIVAAFIAVLAAGAGHGTYAPARVLFPYTMISTVFNENIRSEYILLGLLQFPVYGFILSNVANKKIFKVVSMILFGIHIAAVVFVFVNHNEYFPNTL